MTRTKFHTLMAIASLTLLIPVDASATKHYMEAFESCRAAVDELFDTDDVTSVKRVSFKQRGRVYKVRFDVRVGRDDGYQRFDVRCTTDSKGALKRFAVNEV